MRNSRSDLQRRKQNWSLLIWCSTQCSWLMGKCLVCLLEISEGSQEQSWVQSWKHMEDFCQQVWVEAHSKSSNNALWNICSREWNHPQELHFPLKVNILGENESWNLQIKVMQNLRLTWNKTIVDENHLVDSFKMEDDGFYEKSSMVNRK